MSDDLFNKNCDIRNLSMKDLQNTLIQSEMRLLEEEAKSDLDSDDSDGLEDLRTFIRDVRKELDKRSRRALSVTPGSSEGSSTYSVSRTIDVIEIESNELLSEHSFDLRPVYSEAEPEVTLSKKKKEAINRYFKCLDDRSRLGEISNDRLTASARYFEEVILGLSIDDPDVEVIWSQPTEENITSDDSDDSDDSHESDDSKKCENKLITLNRRTRSCHF